MSPPLKDVLLVGYGAVGAIYSLILKNSGKARVTAVARSNYAAVSAHGMEFRSKKYGDIVGWRPDRVCASVADACDRAYDYVVVTTKAIPELVRTPALLAPLLAPAYVAAHAQPTYVLFQNGLNVERDLHAAVAALGRAPRIISTAVYISTAMLGANVVRHETFDRVSLGMYRPDDYTTTTNSESEQALLDGFAGMLEDGGSTVTVVPEIQRVKYAKNFWNVAFSSIGALTRHSPAAIFSLPTAAPTSASPSSGAPAPAPVSPSVSQAPLIAQHTIPAIRALMQELLALGRALGFPDAADGGLPESFADALIRSTRELHLAPGATHRPSMLVDLDHGRPIEVEVILGEVVRMARGRRVDVPRVEMLYAMLLVVQNQLLQSSGN